MTGAQDTFESKLPGLDQVENDIDIIDAKIDSVKSDTTLIKDDTSKSKASTDYIKDISTPGLGSTVGSLAYTTAEIDRHLHSYWRWYGKLATPSGGKVAAQLGSENSAFTITAGDNAFGAWVQIADINDTPFELGKAFFDIHKIHIESATGSSTYCIQISFGETGAVGLSSKTYSTIPLTPASNIIDSGPIRTGGIRQAAKTKVWARCKRRGQNGGSIDFYYGFHEYEG
jgi:hypothetical protein